MLDRSVEYTAVLELTVLRDLVAEDMVRWARRKRIPSIAVQRNWDCFNLKQMLVAPDPFLIRGEQSFYFARLLHDMPHASLQSAPFVELALPQGENRTLTIESIQGVVLSGTDHAAPSA